MTMVVVSVALTVVAVDESVCCRVVVSVCTVVSELVTVVVVAVSVGVDESVCC